MSFCSFAYSYFAFDILLISPRLLATIADDCGPFQSETRDGIRLAVILTQWQGLLDNLTRDAATREDYETGLFI